MSRPLTEAEVVELDGFGELCGAQLLGIVPAPPRAMELWEREILYGRKGQPVSGGLLPLLKANRGG